MVATEETASEDESHASLIDTAISMQSQIDYLDWVPECLLRVPKA